ncbi:MAG: lipase/acyltransferase domain-containing protein [Steroidobacteraceae bacterium]
MRRGRSSIAMLSCAVMLAACATPRAPDPAQVYPAAPEARPQVPVIIIPGVLGSRLVKRETGEELWPGRTRKLLTSGYLELALRVDPETLQPVDDGLVASGLFDAAAGQDFYRRIVGVLQEAGGYRPGTAGEKPASGAAQFYEFAYDWRQDNLVTVRKLDAMIEQIRRDYGDPALKVDVVAHSMGGLIVRYYERYGTNDVLDANVFPVSGAGVAKLRRIVLLGTPNQGTVTAVHSFLNGYRVALSRLPTEGVATMPAMYQLFPHPEVEWIATRRGKPLDYDLFDVDVWRHFEWSIFNRNVRRRMAQDPEIWPKPQVFERWFEKWLERARRFTWSLMVPPGNVPLIEPLLLGGNCVPTPRLLVLERTRDESAVRLRPEQIARPVPRLDYETLMYEPGDGRVTKSSLLGTQALDPTAPEPELAADELQGATFDCEQHDSLTSNVGFIDSLLDYLLEIDD